MSARIALTLLLFLAGCDPVTGPYPVLDVPNEFREWYAEASACSGLVGDFAAITWRVIPGSTWRHREHGDIKGLWKPPHSIWLASESVGDGELVVHEMLHDLLQDVGHPSPPFGSCDRL